MNDKEKMILSKLFKIASNQQKILQRLAQEQTDPNIAYLKQCAQVTAVNSGFNATAVEVTHSVGGGATDPSTKIMGGYTVKVGGAPKNEEIRQKFIRQLKGMIATQKPDQPELSNLSVFFV